MALEIGTKVFTTEHPNSVGEVIRINETGDATIQFVTPASPAMPYGHIGTEFWPVADQSQLRVVE